MQTTVEQFTQMNNDMAARRPLSVDGVRQPVASPLSPARNSAVQSPTPKATRPKLLRARPFQPVPKNRSGFWGRTWRHVRLPLLLLGGIVAGLFMQQTWFGIAAILIYAVCMIAFHIPSRTTFALATVALAAVCGILVAGSNWEVARSFATYTFLLLVLGVIALSFEAKPQKRRRRRNGR